MTSQIPEDVRIRHCMLFEIKKRSKAAVPKKNICHFIQVHKTFVNSKGGFLSSNLIFLSFRLLSIRKTNNVRQ